MDARASLLGLSLMAVSLAGCIGGIDDEPVEGTAAGPVEEVLHELRELVNVELALPDGLVARGTVYLPDVAEGELVPTLLDLGPYYGNLGGGTDRYDEDFPPSMLYNHFLQRGYAIALVSLRGTGLSEGCFKIGGHEEWSDAAAIVEGLAAQPWSDGTVAMAGISYDGTTPWEAAVMAPPSLKAIVPGEGITDMYRYSFFEGASIWGGPLFNTYYPVYVDLMYTGEYPAEYTANQPTNVCQETIDGMLADYGTFVDGVHDAFWDERDVTPELSKIEAATLIVSGFQDWNVKMDHVQHIWDDLPEPKAMLLGQWHHNVPWRNSFEPEWSIPWYNGTVQDWLDAYVLEDPDALARAEAFGPVAFQDSRGHWYNVSAWPPEDIGWAAKNLTAEGELTTRSAGDDGVVRFRTQVHDEMQQQLGQTTILGERYLVTFPSGPAFEPHWLVGNPVLNLTVSVDLPTGGYLTATLYDAKDDSRFMITKGHLSLAQREGRDQAVDVPTGTAMELSIPMYAAAHVLEIGHHLELVIESEDHEGWADTSYRQQAFTLHVGDGTTSALHLPTWTPPADEA